MDLLIEFDQIQALIDGVREFRSAHRLAYFIPPLILATVGKQLGWSPSLVWVLSLLASGLFAWSAYQHLTFTTDQVPLRGDAADEANADLLAEHFGVVVEPSETRCLQSMLDVPGLPCRMDAADGTITYTFSSSDGQLVLESVDPGAGVS